MSLLIFLQDETSATVITDTLATDEDGQPVFFYDKCVAFPAMNLLVATTGYANLLTRWTSELREHVRARDITMLDLHAPEALRRVWADLRKEFGPVDGTATIYHFGIDEQTGECRRITYRSADDFESEPAAEAGFGVKPPPVSGILPTEVDLESLIALAEGVRAEQDALPHGERLYIGGDLVMAQISASGINFTTIHRFEDQYDAWQAMHGEPPTGIKAVLRRHGVRGDSAADDDSDGGDRP
jgi:hypothetical protein